ncbi:MAG: DUF4160 domain-containing protein [Chloroflexi bacterium]|nr:DUF4160 domain-containing protein [Chloroflexota bacterium]
MFPNDHLPAHVHVYQGEKVARITFETVDLDVMDSYGFRQKELDNICKLLKPYRQRLIELWNAIHPEIPFEPIRGNSNDERP